MYGLAGREKQKADARSWVWRIAKQAAKELSHDWNVVVSPAQVREKAITLSQDYFQMGGRYIDGTQTRSMRTRYTTWIRQRFEQYPIQGDIAPAKAFVNLLAGVIGNDIWAALWVAECTTFTAENYTQPAPKGRAPTRRQWEKQSVGESF